MNTNKNDARKADPDQTTATRHEISPKKTKRAPKIPKGGFARMPWHIISAYGLSNFWTVSRSRYNSVREVAAGADLQDAEEEKNAQGICTSRTRSSTSSKARTYTTRPEDGWTFIDNMGGEIVIKKI